LQLVAVTQLVSATQSIVMQLNNPNLADNERKILEDNLIVTWAAGLTNFSSQVLQPLLLKAAYRVEGKPSELGVFANRVNAGITLATAGFDLYYAYANFSQLNNEHNPAIRQDLIVNGTLSLINAGVTVSTALAILAGSSTTGPLGLVIGNGLMLGSMFYNAYRVVERVEEQVELTAPEKLQLGIGAIFGLHPTYSIQNKLFQQQTESQLKLYRRQSEENFFKQVSQPTGYNLSIISEEPENIFALPLYHLFDNKNNCYLVEQKYKKFEYDLEFLKHDLNIVILPTNLWKQQQIDEVQQLIKRKFTKQEIEKIIAQYPNRYQIEFAKVETYIPASSEPINEMILLSSKFNNVVRQMINQPHIRHNLSNIEQVNAIYSLQLNNQSEYFNESLSSYLSKESIKSYITGISFNLANGDDTIVGYQTVKNQFICGNGKKIFIGGELDDVFILL